MMEKEGKFSSGFCFADATLASVPQANTNLHTHLGTHIQTYGSDPEIFNITTGMEMIGFNIFTSPKINSPHPQNQTHDPSPSSDFYDQFGAKPEYPDWQEGSRVVIDEFSQRCVFPSDQQRQPQGLSLSLGSPGHELQVQNGIIFARNPGPGSLPGQELRSSKYLGPAKELLNEFCSLGLSEKAASGNPQKQKTKNSYFNQWGEENACGGSSSSSSKMKQSHLNPSSLELVELQKRKAKLLTLLDEVDRRYRHYRNQMKAVVSSFEAVAGERAALVYSALASTAMSRHFRQLRDAIVNQIKAIKKAMGEKDTGIITPGMSKGETPRLRILDQALRQQKAFQQMSMIEGHTWRPQRGLPEQSVSVLRAWLFEHFLHPYPSDVDKHILARQTGLSRSQVSNWFINARVRLWKPMVEEMYLEETKEHQDADQNFTITSSSPDGDQNGNGRPKQNPSHSQSQAPDHKPIISRLNSDCLSSILTTGQARTPSAKNSPRNLQSMGRATPEPQAFGTVELDFSSYNQQFGSGGVSNYTDTGSAQQNFGSSGGVSLTLGLQQQQAGRGASSVSLAFSPSQTSLLYGRDHVEECGPVQYSLFEGGGEAQNLPMYRNLMGTQFLHDLTG